MHIIDINLVGVLYTFKLAVHYFRKSPIEAARDRCFVFGGSAAGYLDNLVSLVRSDAFVRLITIDRVAGSIRHPSSG